MRRLNVGILLFNEVEVLDFAGPFEVFSLAENVETQMKCFRVFTFAEYASPVSARNGLRVCPDYTFDDVPEMDILIVPGGYGAEAIEINNQKLLNCLKTAEGRVDTLASVCTGAFLLAEAGILQDQTVTTHWMDLEALQNRYPKLTVIGDVKFVDQGKILTSGGISAGIELSLHIVARYAGAETAAKTAKRMAYDVTA
ncbi:DJ-1/PfpI family protein [Fusibacter paucivorans]|uniref:DJ-1/PfpI family protein n=2 Tax=Fusibacter paucivorans TaxID=76009 RepID=A0ABS5PTK3_9FIRM|nr:DJ-1/PfpI family protein [Fusibacter paucivorans]MBS7528503.1 DJ-1/PfpI family protein [Fusibacter paucivorans]